ncbi:MAG: ABC transporter ATP-binding protein, partial [Actinomyces sp.]
VVLASVLVRPRCLLVLDEPEQRLDHATRLALAETMVAERRAGGALLVVSHDPLLVRAAATSVLLVGDETQMLTVAEGVHAVEEGR